MKNIMKYLLVSTVVVMGIRAGDDIIDHNIMKDALVKHMTSGPRIERYEQKMNYKKLLSQLNFDQEKIDKISDDGVVKKLKKLKNRVSLLKEAFDTSVYNYSMKSLFDVEKNLISSGVNKIKKVIDKVNSNNKDNNSKDNEEDEIDKIKAIEKDLNEIIRDKYIHLYSQKKIDEIINETSLSYNVESAELYFTNFKIIINKLKNIIDCVILESIIAESVSNNFDEQIEMQLHNYDISIDVQNNIKKIKNKISENNTSRNNLFWYSNVPAWFVKGGMLGLIAWLLDLRKGFVKPSIYFDTIKINSLHGIYTAGALGLLISIIKLICNESARRSLNNEEVDLENTIKALYVTAKECENFKAIIRKIDDIEITE